MNHSEMPYKKNQQELKYCAENCQLKNQNQCLLVAAIYLYN